MSQFAGTKNPPWARPQSQSEFINVSSTNTIAAANSINQSQVANTMLPQSVVANPTVYSLNNSTPNLGTSQYTAPQYSAQQLVGLQAQQAAAQAAMQQPSISSPAPTGPVIPQPGIAIPTSLATTPNVSYPTPRAAQPQGPKQRVFTGTITKLHDNFGFVDEDVFFQTSCVKGAQPKVGDRVLVEATFNANMPFKWNAVRIQVLPNQGPQQAGMGGGFNKPSGPISMANSMIQSLATNMPPSGPMNHGGNLSLNQPLQSLMQTHQPPPGLMSASGMRGPISSARRNEPARFERNRERKREMMQEKRERQERLQVARKRSRSRSPVAKRNDSTHQRSPARRRPRIVPRYVVQVPKISFDMKFANVMSLKARYTNMYIPSDFFNANFAWTDAFPIVRPFQLGNHCSFHLFHKDVEGVEPTTAVLDPPDSDHAYNAKVMLLSCPSLDDLYHKSCALAEDSPDAQEGFVHPTRLLNFLVGLKGKNETMAIGGPWSPSLDGPNPGEDPGVLIKTAIRTTKALTGIDLAACTQWYRFVEMQYLRPEETHKGKHVAARVETTVIFFPDVWSCTPTRLEWATLQASYKKQLQKKLSTVSSSDKDDNSQEEENSEENSEPTHFSELDPKTMKIVDLRKELESRTLSSKGLKSQLIARLTKAIKSEQEKEETQENMEVEEEAPEDQKKSQEPEEKTDEKKKEEEEEKKKEREKVSLERKYVLPDDPAIIVHPNPTAKSGKFDCAVMSLSVLLDYRPEDNKEHSFEVSIFAELFNEMLMRDFGFEIYKVLVKAPEKKEEEKKDKKKEEEKKDKDKKSDDKSSKDGSSSSKKKKTDEKDRKDSEKKDKDRKKDDDKKSDGEKKEERADENDGEEESDDKGKKEKKKEKKKLYTKDKDVLLSFTYFDQNHTGYLLDKDVEEIIHTIGLQLSRAQVRKLVQKLVSRDALNYRKLTDRPFPGQSDNKEEAEDQTWELKINEIEKLAIGNKSYIQMRVKQEEIQQCPTKTAALKDEVTPEEDTKEEVTGFVMYKGSVLDITSVMQRLDRSERTRNEMEKQMQNLTTQKDGLKKNLVSKDDSCQKLAAEVKQLKQKLQSQEKLTNLSDTTCKKYLSALQESRTYLTSAVDTIVHALSSDKVKKEEESNGS
ncbi:cell division cycle and apoptosis regulator protein 1-like isoform X2 [Pecten maximus]|uniref:cell division cycle and apoptosis regulator protein 1-like isoform X2 n=1 Tax=Pecten maximus TaxID=6579 RepID=UPI0014581FFE|nr:cell division cycle and apoptosis regulator protein 1-like isoform X2 [Pecten maximus]